MWLSLKRMIGTLLRAVAEGTPMRWDKPFVDGVLPWAIASAVGAPIITTFMDGAAHSSSAGVRMSTGTLSVWISCIGSLVAMVVYSAPLVSAYKSGTVGFGKTGKLVAPVLCAAFLVLVTGLQLEFVHHKGAGFISLGFVRDQVHDMHCNSDVVLMQWDRDESNPVVYRCPTTIMLNPYSSKPFIPWPDYNQGESLDLARVMANFIKDAKDI